MPVQFIGGSSGGGTTDVRTTFAAPILNGALANTTTIVAQYQIPANYLTTNDTLSFKYTGQSGNANSGKIYFYFYIGNTGTLADTKINTEQVSNASYVFFGTGSGTYNYATLFLSGEVYFEAVGVSGLASARYTGDYTTSATTSAMILGVNTNRATVDTTQPVYISLVAVTPTTAVVDTFGSYISVGY